MCYQYLLSWLEHADEGQKRRLHLNEAVVTMYSYLIPTTLIDRMKQLWLGSDAAAVTVSSA